MRSIAPGKHSSVHDLDIENTKPKLTISVSIVSNRLLISHQLLTMSVHDFFLPASREESHGQV